MTTIIKLAKLPKVDMQVATAEDWKKLNVTILEYIFEDPPSSTHTPIIARWHIVQSGSKLVGFVENIKQ